MSDYQPTSELMRLCAKAGGEAVPVSPDLFDVLSRSQEIAKQTDGAFDVTVGPVVRLWRLSRRTQRLPDPEKLAAAKALIGYQHVVLDPKARTVTLKKPGMQLDLGGIAKGFAAEAAQAVLGQQGITRALVAASGDIVLTGPPPDGDGWTVGIGAVSEEEKTAPTLRLHDAAVSTSGDAFQYVEIGGKRYAHIVDPRTGMGMTDIYQVTVVARDGTTSDALATALVVLGPQKGLKLVEEMDGVSARFVRKTMAGIEEMVSRLNGILRGSFNLLLPRGQRFQFRSRHLGQYDRPALTRQLFQLPLQPFQLFTPPLPVTPQPRVGERDHGAAVALVIARPRVLLAVKHQIILPVAVEQFEMGGDFRNRRPAIDQLRDQPLLNFDPLQNLQVLRVHVPLLLLVLLDPRLQLGHAPEIQPANAGERGHGPADAGQGQADDRDSRNGAKVHLH
jgi:thiamine biosynthesis lipoprotein